MNTQPLPFEFSLATPRQNSTLILSVDDEPYVLYTREKILEGKGYDVLSALDGEDALALFDAHPLIDLVLLDYSMPFMDGAVVARQMKARRPSVPIFMVTACEEIVARMRLDCVNAFISKGT